MSYLSGGSNAGAMQQVIISFWFRVPPASIKAAQNDYNNWNDASQNGPAAIVRPPMCGIIPLMTFGDALPVYGLVSPTPQVTVGTFPPQGFFTWIDGDAPICSLAGWRTDSILPAFDWKVPTPTLSGDTVGYMDPSHIGIDCTQSNGKPYLSIQLVMPRDNAPGTIEGSWSPETAYTNSASGYPNFGGGGICPGAPNYYVDRLTGLNIRTVTNPPDGFDSVFSVSDTYSGPGVGLMTRPEVFRNLPPPQDSMQTFPDCHLPVDQNGAPILHSPIVRPDHWHHIILSFDLTSAVSTFGGQSDGSGPLVVNSGVGARTVHACQMWLSFDDTNITKKMLSCYWPDGYGDVNGVITLNAYATAMDNTVSNTGSTHDDRGKSHTNTLTEPLPTYDLSPAGVDMTSLGLPASSAFGNAVKHVEMSEFQMFYNMTSDTGDVSERRKFIKDNGTPVPAVVGGVNDRTPELLLHGVKNWQNGINSSPLNFTGNLNPSGEIDPYRPNPSLNGPQFPPNVDPNNPSPSD